MVYVLMDGMKSYVSLNSKQMYQNKWKRKIKGQLGNINNNYTVSKKNRTPMICLNNSNKSNPILMILVQSIVI